MIHPLQRGQLCVMTLMLFVTTLACSVMTPIGQPSVQIARSTVQANQGWNDTGINVDTGDPLEIEYLSGVWTYWPGKIPPFDANGDPQVYVCAIVLEASLCVEPLPQANKGALIARIGEALPVYIGNHSSFRANGTGVLELSMNDSVLASDYDENEGFVIVKITVTPER